MTEPLPPELLLPVQVRDLPRARVAQLPYEGPAAQIGGAFERLQDFVLSQGVGPCGPLLGRYPRIPAVDEDVSALVRVPISRLVDGQDDIETLRLPRERAACLMFSGLMGPEFRQAHLDLFAWMDAHAIPRAGTAHEHAYLAGTGAESTWTVEIRVPIVGGGGLGLAV